MAITKYIRGRDINIYIERGTDNWVFTACATNMSYERTAEEISITTADSGIENEYEGGATDATGTMDGVITTDAIGGWQYEDWGANVGLKVPLRIDFTNDYGDLLRFEMTVLITNVSAQGDANDYGSFSVGFKRSGIETISKTIEGGLQDENSDYLLNENGVILR